jgi:hypothetical protein
MYRQRLRLPFLHPLGLVDPHSAVALAPAKLHHAKVLAGLRYHLALTNQNVVLQQLVSNRFGGVLFVCGDPALLSANILENISLDQKFQFSP